MNKPFGCPSFRLNRWRSLVLLLLISPPAFAHGDLTPLVIAIFSQVAIIWVLVVFSLEERPHRLAFFLQGFAIYICAVIGSIFMWVNLTELILKIDSSILLRDILGWATLLVAWLLIPIGSVYLFRRRWRIKKHRITNPV